MAAGIGFRALDLSLATTFGRAARRAGVARIVYLGALGGAPSSAHLASRQEVGTALAAAGVAVVELRAAVVFGSGSISFEMLRNLTERLPAMVCPRWVRTRIQPIGLGGSPRLPRGVDSGCPRCVRNRRCRQHDLSRHDLRLRPGAGPPAPSHHRYSVADPTPVVVLGRPGDAGRRAVSHALIESLVTEVVVVDGARDAGRILGGSDGGRASAGRCTR